VSYAANTSVTPDESQAEIRGLLTKHGATDICVGLNGASNGVVKFTRGGRHVRLLLHLPPTQPRERPRRWRVLALLLKAKLEAVDSGIGTFDAEFMSYIAMPGGCTVGSIMAPKISAAYAAGRILEAPQ
jgi:hypothetical protein